MIQMEDKLTTYTYVFTATELHPYELHGIIHTIEITQFEKKSDQNNSKLQKRILADAYHRAIERFFEDHSYLASIRFLRKERGKY